MRRASMFLLAILLFAWAAGHSAAIFAAEKRAEEQKFCPVFTDQVVGPQSRFLRYRGIKIFFSSDLAARKWMRDPVSYLDKELLPQLGDLILAERQIPQHYCPVYRTRKVNVKDPSVIYQEKRVYLFDQTAVRIWNSAPEKFLDPAILPQFAEEEKSPDDMDNSQP